VELLQAKNFKEKERLTRSMPVEPPEQIEERELEGWLPS
jgi:hypothetical protein